MGGRGRVNECGVRGGGGGWGLGLPGFKGQRSALLVLFCGLGPLTLYMPVSPVK